MCLWFVSHSDARRSCLLVAHFSSMTILIGLKMFNSDFTEFFFADRLCGGLISRCLKALTGTDTPTVLSTPGPSPHHLHHYRHCYLESGLRTAFPSRWSPRQTSRLRAAALSCSRRFPSFMGSVSLLEI